MKIYDKFRDEKLKYDINRREGKYEIEDQVKLICINILQVKKYCRLIKEE